MKPGTPTSGPKDKPKPDPTLGEILSGVDIIGTMLHLDLPKLEQQIAEIKALVSQASAGERPSPRDTTDAEAALEEIKEMLQLQGERLLSLERRLAHLTTLCEEWGNSSEETS